MSEIVGYFSKDPMVAWPATALIVLGVLYVIFFASAEHTRDQANLLVLSRLASEGALINKYKVLISVGGVPVLVRYFLHRDSSGSAHERLNVQIQLFVPGSIRLSLKDGVDCLDERLGLTTKDETGDPGLDKVFCFAGKDIENFKTAFSSLEGKSLLKELFSKFDILEIKDGCCELTETPCAVMGEDGPERVKSAAERLIKLVSLIQPKALVVDPGVIEKAKTDLLRKEERRELTIFTGWVLLLGILFLNLLLRSEAVAMGSVIAGAFIWAGFVNIYPWSTDTWFWRRE